MNQFALGQSVRRIEAPRLVTGRGPRVYPALDALTPLGIRHVDMSATPDKLWRLIRDARRKERTV